MKKNFLYLCAFAVTLIVTSGIHAAAYSTEDTAPETFLQEASFEFFEMLLRQFARDAFFKQLTVVRAAHPEITEPRELFKTVLAQVTSDPKRSDFDDLFFINKLVFSVRDLIDQDLMPAVERDWLGRQELDLSGMHINDLTGIQDVSGLQNIRILNLSNNALRTIPLDAFANLNLESLNLSNNQLHTISLDTFASLNNITGRLNLENNQLKTILPDAFRKLHNLHSLSLEHNQLEALAPGAFAGLRWLSWLNLNNNPISSAERARIKIEVKECSPHSYEIQF